MARKSQKTLQTQVSEAGRRTPFLFPMSVAIIASIFQSVIIKDYKMIDFVPASLAALLTLVIVIVAFIVKRPSRRLRAVQHLSILMISIVSFGYLLPLPNPYMVLLPTIGVLFYTEYGLLIMSLAIWGMFAFVTARFLQINGLGDLTKLTDYLLIYVFSITMTYYLIIFLRINERELDTLEEVSGKALADEQQVQSLINNITDGVVAVDQHNRIVIYNAAALDVLDVNTAISKKKIANVFKPIDAQSQPVDIAKLLQGITTPTNNRDLRLQYSDGSIANIFLGIAPIYLGYGKSQNNGYTLIMRDITREKSLEEERDEFISVVSHELRTPIAITEGSISNAQFIADKTGDMDTIRKTLKESHNQVIFLADMINDLSTLSRAERGTLEIELATINISDLIAELAENYKSQAEVKGLTVLTDVAKNVGDLQSSKLYVREILQNFITNAIKYTETGTVTIKATANPKGIDFEVIDTGIGISKGDQKKVFDKFFRSEDYRTRANNGTGLGLYVTMKLVRLIHAELAVTSELNKGSTFSIFIPNLK
jgi:signal transduction histidine kinase